MTRLLVTAHGPDRPGMVAAVTNALAQKQCNLEDTSMTRLGGHFTMLLLVSTKDSVSVERANDLFDGVENLEGLFISASVQETSASSPVEGDRWAVSVYGGDQQGIVAAVTGYLASVGVNVEDLSTRLTGEPSAPVYTMLLDVTVPTGIEGGEVATELDRLASELGITCHARAIEVDTF